MTDEVLGTDTSATNDAGTASADKGGGADKSATAAAATLAAGGDKGGDAGKAGGDGVKTAQPDWRDGLAGEDKAFRSQLDRYASPAEVGKAYRSLQQKLSSGEYRRELPADATDEQKAAWRKEMGVPDKWEDYGQPKLDDGLVLSERDKPLVDGFTQLAHAEGLKPALRDKILNWHYNMQDALASERADADAEFKTKSEDVLRADWAGDFRPNINAIGNMLAQYFPGDLASQLLAGRTFDGKKFGDDPRFMKVFAQIARELDPAATLVAPVGGAPGSTVESRLAEIRKFAQEKPDDYDRDKAMQQEREKLIEIQNKQRGRKAA